MIKGILKMLHVVLVFFLILVPANCYNENFPNFDIKCYEYGFNIRVGFAHPFKGAVYFKGQDFNHHCSFRPSASSNLLEINFNISSADCGTDIQSESGRSMMKNTIVVRQHSLVKTSGDLEETINCQFLDPVTRPILTKPENLILSDVNSKLDVQKGYQLFGKKRAAELNLYNAPFLVFSVLNKKDSNINDINVQNCIVHEDMVLGKKSLFHQMTHPSGCPDLPTDILSSFTVTNVTKNEGLIAYAHIKFNPSSIKELHITCGVQICETECKNKCSKKFEKDKLTTIATHKIKKRSTAATPDLPTQRQYEVRDQFLKSVVRALSEKLLKRGRRPRLELEDTQNMVKRAGNPMDDGTEDVEKLENLEISTLETESLDVEPQTISFVDVEAHEPELSNNFYKNPDFPNLIPESEMEEIFSTVETLAYDLATSTAEITGPENSMEDLNMSANESIVNKVRTEKGPEPTDVVDDLITHPSKSHVNEDNNRDSNFELPETGEESGLDNSNECVPRLTFTVVTIVLGFTSFTLSLICCGMVLHIKKEKKRNFIDNFLLYNFY